MLFDSELCNHVRTQAGLRRSQGTAAAAEKSCCFQPVIPLRCCRLPGKSSLLRILLINLSRVQFFLFLNEYLRLDCYGVSLKEIVKNVPEKLYPVHESGNFHDES